MSMFTKLATFDKAIAEMHSNNRLHQKRMELGEHTPSLRSSCSNIYNTEISTGSDSENDASGSNGSWNGSLGRNSYLSEENNSPSSLSLSSSYAFMGSGRGSRILHEEDLARLGDQPIDFQSESNNAQITFDKNIRSPTLGKDKRAEYFAKIKSDLQGGIFPSTPPLSPASSSPESDEFARRNQRFSALMNAKIEKDLEKEKENEEKEKEEKADNDKDRDKEEKKKAKEKLKEEKLRKKQEKKDIKSRLKAQERENAPSPDSSRIINLLGAVRPRASLSSRGGSASSDLLEDQLKKSVDSSSPKENSLRRSTSFKDLEPLDPRPKFEKILGPVPEMNFMAIPDEKPSWRKTKIIKNVISDPLPLNLPPPPPPPTSGVGVGVIPEDDDEPKPVRRSGVPKYHRILGENPIIANAIEITSLDPNPVTVDTEVDEDGIVFSDVRDQSGHKLVKGATLKKLVERITCENLSDPTFLLQFIITYRSFTNPHELLELLKSRFESGIEITPDVTDSQREVLTKKQLIIRLRVYNVIKQWIDKQWMDFMEDNSLVEKMLKYAPMLNEVVSQKSSAIDKLIEKRFAEGEKQKTIMFSTPPPRSFIPTVPKEKLQLMDMNSEEIARQMTLMEYSLFKAIKPWEYLCWNTKMKQTKSANILAMINKFNVMSKWVQREVLHGGEQPKQRAGVIGKFLEICEHLRTQKNFNGIMEILSGLNASSIHRLKLTWGCLSSKQTETFQELNSFTGGTNYKNLRTALHTLQPPCIPYLGMYLTDLTFINDGIPLYLPETCLINFDKCRKVSASVLEIMQYQQTPFCLNAVDEIQFFLSSVEKYQTESEDAIYKLSLALEERK